MTKTRADVFRDYQPELKDADAVPAIQAGRTVVSFMALPVPDELPNIQFLAVKFVLADGTTETIALDRYAAGFLRTVVQRFDEGDWKMSQETPAGRPLQ